MYTAVPAAEPAPDPDPGAAAVSHPLATF